MAFQFYKRFPIIPGLLRLNISCSRSGLSFSFGFGPRGASISAPIASTSRRRRRAQINVSPVLFGIRGTGLRWRSFF